jgi:hypothetical protein
MEIWLPPWQPGINRTGVVRREEGWTRIIIIIIIIIVIIIIIIIISGVIIGTCAVKLAR